VCRNIAELKELRMKSKPELFLIPGAKVHDVDVLAVLFEKLTGRKPTPLEMADAKNTLKKEDKQTAKK
jgi:hypothetical protein